MADAPDLGSGVSDVGVQVPSSALKVLQLQSFIVNFSQNPTRIYESSFQGGKNFHVRNCNNG